MRKSIEKILPAIASLVILFQNYGYSQHLYEIEQLPQTVNSGFEEIKPFTNDSGDSLFFIRSYSPQNVGGEHAEEDIWLSVLTKENEWSKATNQFGYRNRSGPDIFIGLLHGGKSLYTIAYSHTGQNRFVKVNQHNLQNHNASDSSLNKSTIMNIGNDYHDLYLNPDGNILLISMNALNSIGQEDIYVSLKNEAGDWSSPANLGPSVNSRDFEISPFLSADEQILYFASNGYDGFGDSDIYFSKRSDEGWQNWAEPVNMGSPINSMNFDAYLFINQKDEMFMASNRNGNYSDIFKITKQGTKAITNSPNIAKTNDFINQGKVHSAAKTIKPLNISVYFDFDEYKLSKEALKKLDDITLKTMADSKLCLQIYGYTDDAGSQSYNKNLSKKRAKFVYQHFKKSGINKDKLSMEGKGVFIASDKLEVPDSTMRKVEVIVVHDQE